MRLTILAMVFCAAGLAAADNVPEITLANGKLTFTVTVDVSDKLTEARARVAALSPEERAAARVIEIVDIKRYFLVVIQSIAKQAITAIANSDAQLEAQKTENAAQVEAVKAARPTGTVDLTP